MPRLPLIALLPVLAACGTDTFATVKGELDGEAFRPTLFYWGGPYIVFSTQDGDCMDALPQSRAPMDHLLAEIDHGETAPERQSR